MTLEAVKPRVSNLRNRALTLIEVVVVIIALILLAALLLPLFVNRGPGPLHINCKRNLLQIGLAYVLYANDNGDKYPTQVSVTNGGVKELAAAGNVVACCEIISNYLTTPKLFVCPQDSHRVAATNFGNDFNNSHISYFVGVDASRTYPRSFLCGDDNFAIGDVPVKSGLLQVSRNAPISWTAARHKSCGNLGYADGSVQGLSNPGLQGALQETGLATNRLAIP